MPEKENVIFDHMKKGSNSQSVFYREFLVFLCGRDSLVEDDARFPAVNGSLLSMLANRQWWCFTKITRGLTFSITFLRQ